MTIQENINCRDSAGRNSTPLHLAAGYNNLEVAEYLLEQVRVLYIIHYMKYMIGQSGKAKYLLDHMRVLY